MKRILPVLTMMSILIGCGHQQPLITTPYPQMTPGLQQIPFQIFRRAVGDLVEVPGFQSGDRLKIDGPLWYDGDGKVYSLLPDSFKVELNVGGAYHSIIDTRRIDEQQSHIVLTDLKNNGKVEEHGATYSRTGNRTHFEIGPGGDVESFTINGKRSGYFEIDIKQPNRTVKLKVTKG